MLQAHSFLWHYLWVAPNVLLLVLAACMWKRGLARELPAFFAFITVDAFAQLGMYVADVSPVVGPETWWHLAWVSLIIDGVLKAFLIAEIYDRNFRSYDALAKLGRILIRAVGVTLIMASAVLAAVGPQDGRFGIIAGEHSLEQGIYLVESGLLLAVLVLAALFKLRPPRPVFGIAVGLAISACVHLASWAVMASGGLPNSKRAPLVFLNMATYHACVLIWFYFVLVPVKVKSNSGPPMPPIHNLEVWNREVGRLLHP
ncbi:MAG TPA: hypothetical protein VMX38_11865 [Verrucomicrobiae bacterium]|jgi:hypothetical protein|nr:hypothetical protein [Verrucomicrobiae bacterium]